MRIFFSAKFTDVDIERKQNVINLLAGDITFLCVFFIFLSHKMLHMEVHFMRRIKKILAPLIVMIIISLVCLVIVSLLTYIFKWQADKALIGITVTYILTGLVGGFVQKRQIQDEKSMGQKMLEAIFLSSVFIMILVMVSIFVVQIPFELSSRFFMIFMLFVGSTCLGRIL